MPGLLQRWLSFYIVIGCGLAPNRAAPQATSGVWIGPRSSSCSDALTPRKPKRAFAWQPQYAWVVGCGLGVSLQRDLFATSPAPLVIDTVDRGPVWNN